MGFLSFRVPPTAAHANDLLKAAVAGGHDRAPTPTRCGFEAGTLLLERDHSESGPSFIPWEVPDVGHLMAMTTTLMERERPYHLGIELARGKLNQVRNQYADWQSGGLSPVPIVEELLKKAITTFGQAILDAAQPKADAVAQEALRTACMAADQLVLAYQSQVFRLRHQRQPKFDTLLGCRLTKPLPVGLQDVYRLSFNAVCVPLTWRQIEAQESEYRWEDVDAIIDWATEQNLPVYAGPLIDFSAEGLPDFVLREDLNPVTLKSLMSDYIETVVTRYRGKVARWLISSNSNGVYLPGIPEEELIRLTAMAADAAWQIESNAQVIFGVTHPFSDYLGEGRHEFSGFVFADTLLRAGLPFAGIELECPMATAPRGNFCRDLLDLSRQLDLFGLLGTPIQVTLAYPSARLPDAKALPFEQTEGAGYWRDISSTAQANWATAAGSLVLCKSYVHSIFWDHLCDADPHRFPNAGLVDARGTIKPSFDRLRELREVHLH